jgi:50S ribosomal subunit-associated GTPase HflX
LFEDVKKTFSGLRILTVANKADLLDENRVRQVREACADAIFIVATTGQGVGELSEKLLQVLPTNKS